MNIRHADHSTLSTLYQNIVPNILYVKESPPSFLKLKCYGFVPMIHNLAFAISMENKVRVFIHFPDKIKSRH